MGIIQIRQFTNDLTDDDMKPKSAEGQFLQEGRYSVKVVEVTEPKNNAYDTTWHECQLIVANDAGKITRMDLYIPTTKLTTRLADGSESNYRARDLNKIAEAMFGESLPKGDVSPFIRKRFADVSKLVGVRFDCTVGHPYGRAYAKKIGGAVKILDKDGKVLEPDFADFKAAKAYAEEHKIKYSAFPKVIEVHSKKTVQDDSEVPF